MTQEIKRGASWREGYMIGYKEAEAAYGACHFCYGKGYATVGEMVRACSCPRGLQIRKIARPSLLRPPV